MKTNEITTKQSSLKSHKHTWIVASIAIALAVLTVVLLPQNKGYSMLFAGVAGGHIMIGLIALFAGWIVIPQKILDKIWGKKSVEGYDFGWSPKWLYSFAIAAFVVFILSVYLYFTFDGSSIARLSIYTLLLLLSVNLFAGFIVLQNSRRQAKLTLPMVTLLPNGEGKILDAGCGAGRTTIAIAQALPNALIVSFDRFDADYIEGGGTSLLKRNIAISGIEQRVTIEKGDITATSFTNNTFDAVISSYMFDHLGANKRKALAETYRIMKPGGRFLLIIAIRSYSTFAIGNVLSLLFPSRNKWVSWIEQAGFKMISDGKINEGAYFCFEKPINR